MPHPAAVASRTVTALHSNATVPDSEDSVPDSEDSVPDSEDSVPDSEHSVPDSTARVLHSNASFSAYACVLRKTSTARPTGQPSTACSPAAARSTW